MLLLGAGASTPAMPLANEIKHEILVQAMKAATSISSGSHDRKRLADLEQRLAEPHLTLELLCAALRYRLRLSGEDIARLLRSVLGGIQPNAFSRAVAALRKAERLGPILTANADTLLYRAIVESGAQFRLVTKSSCATAAAGDLAVEIKDICAFRGTLLSPADVADDSFPSQTYAPPAAVDMHGMARPFSPQMTAYLKAAFHAYPRVLVFGYSGNDHYDMNLLLRRAVRDRPNALDDWLCLSADGDRGALADLFVDKHGSIRSTAFGQASAKTFCTAAASLLALPGGRYDDTPANELEWTERVSEYFSQRLSAIQHRLDLSELIDDLEKRLHYAWVVAERFQLDNFGYDPIEIRAFGGLDRGESGRPRGYENVAYGAFVEAQEEFWRLRNIAGPAGPASIDAVITRFTKIQRDIALALNRPRRDIDQAMLLVGQAICQNHIGLAEMQRLRAGVRGDDATKIRAKARTRFRRAVGLAEQAKARAIKVDDVVFTQARDGAEGIVWHIVPADLWELAARDNLCRTLERDDAIAGLRDVILARLRLVNEDDAAYAAGHYVRLCRLGLDLVKYIYQAQGETQAPADAASIESENDGGEFIRIGDWAIDEVMENAVDRYRFIAGDRHPWLLAWFDARLIREAARRATGAAEAVVKEAQTFFPAEAVARQPELALAMRRFQRRTEECRKANLIGGLRS
ncbi:MAG: hypothetical protein EXQ89_02665 [Rhodospirillaceae bacterium]|nr:hypothetical protein [Rhodospirillaceae bacterium]